MAPEPENNKLETVEIIDNSPPQFDTPKKSSDDDICELEHLRKLFIGGLAPYTTEEGLKEFYGQWGNVVDVVVMRDPINKRSRGFGFITYTKSTMVDKAQDNRPHVIDGKTVEAKRALPRPERESRETNISVKKLFVGGLKDNHDDDCLRDYFAQFGNVISVKILTDKTTGKRRGFAFIEFDDYDAVDKAILHKTHSIKYVVVDVKKSVYKQEKKQEHLNNNAPANNSYDNKTQQSMKQPSTPQTGYRPPQPQQTMPPYPQPPPMTPGPVQPNYNYWGPPPSTMPTQYATGPYQQPPPPQMNTWNTQPNYWNAGPPPPPASAPPPNNWYPNQWGNPPLPGQQPPAGPPSAVPPPATNWNAAPMPPSPAPNNGPPQPPPQQQQQQPPPNNFGAGYQQSYGGGPVKHNNMNNNRMNPYSAPPNGNYANNNTGPAYNGYGNNNKQAGTAQPVGPPGVGPKQNGVPQQQTGSKYRR